MAINDPTDITNLVAWKDPKDTSTITVDGSDTVTQFDDKTATGADYTTVIGTPKSGTRTYNGHNVIDFDGSSSLSTFSGIEPSKPSTIHVAFVVDVITGSNLVVSSSDRLQLSFGMDGGEVSILQSGSWYGSGVFPSIGDFVTMTVVYDDNNTIFYVNGVDTNTSVNDQNRDFEEGMIGARTSNFNNPHTANQAEFDGAYCGHALYDRSLTSTEASDLHDWSVAHYAVASSGTDIDPTSGGISISGNAVVLQANTNISVNLDSISIAGEDVELDADAQISPLSVTLPIQGQDATLQANANISIINDSIDISGQSVAVATGFVIIPDVASLSVQGQDVFLNLTLLPQTDNLQFVVGDVIVSSGGNREIVANSADLFITGQDITALVESTVSPENATLQVNGNSLLLEQDYIITPGTATISIMGQLVDVDAVFLRTGTGPNSVVGVIISDIIQEIITFGETDGSI